MNTISILIPSRGNPKELLETIKACEDMASEPARLEFVVRLDADDPALKDYVQDIVPTVAWRRSIVKGEFAKWLVGERLGYKRIHDYYEECYKLSSGELLLAFNDDMLISTKGWDVEYERVLEHIPFGVARCEIDEDPGGNYGWAMPMVRRDLCKAIGCFCRGTETCDRIFEAYAQQSRRAAGAAVRMVHKWSPLKPGSQREEVYRYAMDHWPEMTARWNRAATEMAAIVQSLRP